MLNSNSFRTVIVSEIKFLVYNKYQTFTFDFLCVLRYVWYRLAYFYVRLSIGIFFICMVNTVQLISFSYLRYIVYVVFSRNIIVAFKTQVHLKIITCNFLFAHCIKKCCNSYCKIRSIKVPNPHTHSCYISVLITYFLHIREIGVCLSYFYTDTILRCQVFYRSVSFINNDTVIQCNL